MRVVALQISSISSPTTAEMQLEAGSKAPSHIPVILTHGLQSYGQSQIALEEARVKASGCPARG